MNGRCVLLLLIVLSLILAGSPLLASEAGSTPAWQASFDEVCAGTTNAMTLSAEELDALLGRCVALEVEIAQLDPTRAKIYGKRLDLACNLYRFVLQEKQVRGM